MTRNTINRVCFALGGFIAGAGATIAVAVAYGSYEQRTERDPISNRIRVTESRLSMRIAEEIIEDEVSAWVDLHLPKGMYYGQYGWQVSTSTHRSWFGQTSIGCGGPGSHATIPALIYNREITEDGVSREALLQRYLAEIPNSFKAHGNMRQFIADWRRRWTDAEQVTAP
jgi:hypothetical protein